MNYQKSTINNNRTSINPATQLLINATNTQIEQPNSNKNNMSLSRPATPVNQTIHSDLHQQTDILYEKTEPTNSDLMRIMQTIQQSQEFISNRFDEFNGTVRQLQDENLLLKSNVNKLEHKMQLMENELGTIQSELNKIQQEKLNNQIVITGIPTEQNPSTIIPAIASILKIELSTTDIKSSRFLQKKNQTLKYAPLLIEFNKQSNIGELLIQKYKQNGPLLPTQLNIPQSQSIKKIFINEYLTDNNRNLITQARKLRNTHNFKFIWYKNGYIWAKQNEGSNTYKLSSMLDLQNLITQINNQN